MQLFVQVKAWIKELKHDVLTLWFAIRNPKTSITAKLLAIFTTSYALSPIDLIPDFVPILGYLDDIILIPFMVWLCLRLIPENVLRESRQSAQEWLMTHSTKPISYYGFTLIISIWFIVGITLWYGFVH